jgi:hypothetical protein
MAKTISDERIKELFKFTAEDKVLVLKRDGTWCGPVHPASSTFDFPVDDDLHPDVITCLIENERAWLADVPEVQEYMRRYA